MRRNEMMQLLQGLCTDIIENMNPSDEMYRKYFSPDYVHQVDGFTLNFDGLVRHMNEKKAVIQAVKVSFPHILVEGDKMCAVHLVHYLMKDGREIEKKVIALLQVKDHQFILCDELTYIIKGTQQDQYLGLK